MYLSNAEQAAGIIEWLDRWKLSPTTTKVIADDAVFAATEVIEVQPPVTSSCWVQAASRRKDEQPRN